MQARYYEQLRPFERASLETFSSDAELHRYLDAAAFMHESGVFDRLDGDVPKLPRVLASRLRADRPNASNELYSWRAMIGLLSYGPAQEPLSRLVRQRDRVYSLHENQLRSFDLSRGDKSLILRSTLTLGPPVPTPHVEEVTSVDGHAARFSSYPDGALTGVTIFDTLLVTDSEILVLGNRQDRWGVQLVRIAIGAHGELRQTSSQAIYYAAHEYDGYRARLVDGALVLYFRDDPFYFESSPQRHSTAVYAFPSLADVSTRAGSAPGLFHGADVYRPLVHAGVSRLHTLLRCDLRTVTLDCSARAILGPDAAALHVSNDAIYLWFVGWRSQGVSLAGSFIYRVPLDGSAPGVVRVRGQPPVANVPSLHATSTALHAIVAGTSHDSLELLRIPIAMFATEAVAVPERNYRLVQDPTHGKLDSEAAKFVGGHLLWGSQGDGRGYNMRMSMFARTLEVVPLDGGASVSLPIDHAASYLTELDGQALIVGTDSWNLHASLLDLSHGTPHWSAKYVMRDAVRDLSGHRGAVPLLSVGNVHWLALDIAPSAADGQTWLPLRWTSRSATLTPAPLWTVPIAKRSRLQPPGTETLRLDDEHLLLRMQNELRLYEFSEEAVLTQTLVLGG
ncbi:MAG: hypothetical protein JWN04_4158 [Myxococcaceae bacterium]|nr:hypothetical protein [Myxococcaceae bacterium]